ncbi:unnamed protein product [Urochloa decumbens]|uniref:Uncharacterized protein n=1 Tax=Urochloa decumbens TaxID=240449 RepID=A0ABC9B659_9POAL
MPSAPPSPKPLGHPSRRPAREICVVPRTAAIDTTDAGLSSCALVAAVGGARPAVTISQVGRFIEEFYALLPGDYTAHRFEPEDFLVVFASPAIADRVLHSSLPPEAPFQLIWKRWRRQAMASWAPLRFKVLVELKGIPAHARSIDTAQIALGSACSGLVLAPEELAGNNLRYLYVAAWCIHPDLIPQEKLMFIPEPPESVGGGNLFLQPHEIIHSKHDGLWYRVEIRVLEVQDWADESSSESSEDEDYPGFRQRHRRQPWPRIHRLDGAAGAAAGLSLGPGWGSVFAPAGTTGGHPVHGRAGAMACKGNAHDRAWSLEGTLRFGCVQRTHEVGATTHGRQRAANAVVQPLAPSSSSPVRCQRLGNAVEQPLAARPGTPRPNDPPLDALLTSGPPEEKDALDPMRDEDGRWTRDRSPRTPSRHVTRKAAVAWEMGDMLPVGSPFTVAPLGMDPMTLEAALTGPLATGPQASPPGRSRSPTPGSGTPAVTPLAPALVWSPAVGSPVEIAAPTLGLEAVRFSDAPMVELNNSPDHAYVTTVRGSNLNLPFHIPPEACTPVRANVARFASNICRPRTPGVLNQTPPRRKARTLMVGLPFTPRRSERLAKKSVHRPTKPALQAQNVLMKKLGISSAAGPPDAAAFQRFLDVFIGTVTTSQCEAMDAILPDGASFVDIWSEVAP